MRERTYVVGIDFSAASRAALDAVAALARRTGAKLDLFCVVPPSVALADRDFESRVAENLEALALRAGCETARRHVVVAPDTAEAITRHASSRAADLIAVGPRGEGRWRKLVLGSVTERLLRAAPTMLLVVRAGLAETPKRILVAIDRTPGSARALRVAIDLARVVGAKVLALHVAATPGAAFAGTPGIYVPETRKAEKARVVHARRDFANWVARFPADGVAVEARVVEGSPVEAILAEARAGDAPLVVVGSHGKTAVHEFFVGSVAHGVTTHAPVSVLVVRARPVKRLRPIGRRRSK